MVVLGLDYQSKLQSELLTEVGGDKIRTFQKLSDFVRQPQFVRIPCCY